MRKRSASSIKAPFCNRESPKSVSPPDLHMQLSAEPEVGIVRRRCFDFRTMEDGLFRMVCLYAWLLRCDYRHLNILACAVIGNEL